MEGLEPMTRMKVAEGASERQSVHTRWKTLLGFLLSSFCRADCVHTRLPLLYDRDSGSQNGMHNMSLHKAQNPTGQHDAKLQQQCACQSCCSFRHDLQADPLPVILSRAHRTICSVLFGATAASEAFCKVMLTEVEKDIEKWDKERAASHSSSCADGTHLCSSNSKMT